MTPGGPGTPDTPRTSTTPHTSTCPQTPARAVAALAAAGWTVAVAESLTGGLVGAALTGVPGASAVFRGGVTAYATEVKHTLLGVDASLLAREGPVSARTAGQMAAGVRALLGADCGMATTGVAGPGPRDGHPAGEVHVAVAWPGGTAARALRLSGSRECIRRETVEAVLALFVRSVTGVGSR